MLDEWADATQDSGTSLSSDRAHSHRLFYERTLAIIPCVLGTDHFQLFLQLPACPAVAEVRSLSQDGYGYNYMGQTENPRREEWSVSSFSRCCCATSQRQHVKGHPSRSHGSITWSTDFSDGVHWLIIGTIVMFEEERVEFLMSKLVRVVLDVRLSPSVGTGEAVSLPVDWCAWENKPTRDSWEHVGAPERALLGGSCCPRIPGSHCF